MFRTKSHEDILFSQELDVVPCLSGARIHKVPSLVIQPSDLEQIDHIVNIRLIQSEGSYSSSQVRVTVEIVCLARQYRVDVRVTTRTKQVVDAAPMLILAIPGKTVCDDGDEWAHVR